MPEYTTSRTLREITRIIASRFWMMLIILAIPIAAVWYVTAITPKQYRSRVQLLTRLDAGTGTDDLTARQAATLESELSLFVKTQREIIKSDYVIGSAMLMLDGAEGPEPFSDAELLAERDAALVALAERQGAMTPEEYERRRDKILNEYEAKRAEAVRRWRATLRDWDKTVAEYIRANTRELREVNKRVEIVTPGGPEASFTRLFTIRVDWPEEPDLAAERDASSTELATDRARAMAGHIVDAYQVRWTQLKSEEAELAAERVVDIEVYRQELQQANRSMREFVQRPEVRGHVNVLQNMYGPQARGLETGIAANLRRFAADADDMRIDEARWEHRMSVLEREADKAERIAELRARYDRLRAAYAGEPMSPADRAAWERREAELAAVVRDEAGEPVPDMRSAVFERGFRELIEEVRAFDIVLPDPSPGVTSALQDVNARAVALKLQLNNLTTMLSYLHEDVLRAGRELLSVWETLALEVESERQRVADMLAGLDARVAAVSEVLGTGEGGQGLRDQIQRLEPLAVEYHQLQDAVNRAQSIYDEAKREQIRAREARQAGPEPILPMVVDGPNRPDPAEPHWPILWLNVLIAAVAGLVLALVYAFLSDHFDHTIKSIDDAERHVGAPVLASVPKLGWGIIRT